MPTGLPAGKAARTASKTSERKAQAVFEIAAIGVITGIGERRENWCNR